MVALRSSSPTQPSRWAIQLAMALYLLYFVVASSRGSPLYGSSTCNLYMSVCLVLTFVIIFLGLYIFTPVVVVVVFIPGLYLYSVW